MPRRWNQKVVLGIGIIAGALGLSARGADVWDITGPIDPNYLIELSPPPQEPSLSAGEYLEGDTVFESEQASGSEGVGEVLNRVIANEINRERLVDPGCHRAKLPGLMKLYQSHGYSPAEVNITYSEAPYENWTGHYYRQMQTVKVRWTNSAGSNVVDSSTCKTDAWRWITN